MLFLPVPAAIVAAPAESQPWTAPGHAAEGKARPRPEFISYDIRSVAEARDRSKASHYVSFEGKWQAKAAIAGKPGGGSTVYGPVVTTLQPISSFGGLTPPQIPSENPVVQFTTEIEIPVLWLDRDLFLHVDGIGTAYALFVNEKRMGYSEDSRTPAEYDISDAVTDGLNRLRIDTYGYSTGSWLETLLPSAYTGTLRNVYLYSQPKLHIENFTLSTRPDTTGKHILADIAVIMSNSYSTREKITLGYDIYSPEGKLLTYNLCETELDPYGCDTLRFREYLYGSFDKIGWSPASPNLYKLMFYTRRAGRITEYIPLKLGIKWVDVVEGELRINGKRAELRPAYYDAGADAKTTQAQLEALKKQRYNTLYVGYPQPGWFYELCDRVGFYVVDQANINTGFRTDDRNVGGTLANRPEYLPAFLDRAAFMRGRSKNHVCVLALSLGGASGNGYNFYKTYQWLKQTDTLHPVIYRDVQGEWNSDLKLPDAADVADVLKAIGTASDNRNNSPAAQAGQRTGTTAPVRR